MNSAATLAPSERFAAAGAGASPFSFAGAFSFCFFALPFAGEGAGAGAAGPMTMDSPRSRVMSCVASSSPSAKEVLLLGREPAEPFEPPDALEARLDTRSNLPEPKANTEAGSFLAGDFERSPSPSPSLLLSSPWSSSLSMTGSSPFAPPAFAEAKSLWEKDGERNFGKIQDLLSRYVSADFLPEGITGADQLFTTPYNCELLEVSAVGFDFSRGNIPLIKAEAWFAVDVVKGFHEIDLDHWQNENDRFYSGATFFWEIEGCGDEFDFTWENHSGCEGICLGPVLDDSADDFPRGE